MRSASGAPEETRSTTSIARNAATWKQARRRNQRPTPAGGWSRSVRCPRTTAATAAEGERDAEVVHEAQIRVAGAREQDLAGVRVSGSRGGT